MKAAILGNGPSRVAYTPADYDLVLGCNFPWCPVDATVIVDTPVALKMSGNLDLIDRFRGVYLNETLHRYLSKIRYRNNGAGIILDKCLGTFPFIRWETSGHHAAQIAISAGANLLSIFGMDSYFEHTVKSYTTKYIPNTSTSPSTHVTQWRRRWQEKINRHPEVTFNFVRGIDDYITAVPENLPKG